MLASDQVQFSLLYRKHEKDGLLAKAKQLGVSVIAYSPLAQGMLTGLLLPSAIHARCTVTRHVASIHVCRQAGRESDRQTGRQAGRQAGTWKDRHSWCSKYRGKLCFTEHYCHAWHKCSVLWLACEAFNTHESTYSRVNMMCWVCPLAWSYIWFGVQYF